MNPIPREWLDPVRMQRIILHWSEGRRVANSTDREHYHFLIEHPVKGAPAVSRGDHSIQDNLHCGDGDYAAHTKGSNTGSIGVALCGMVGCRETPFHPGQEPFTREQFSLLCEAVAQLCRFYKIPCTPRTVLCHGEVQETLGITQNGKWDPMKLPWAPEASGAKVAALFRSQISELLAA